LTRRTSTVVELLAGFQWLGFMFANTVVIPLSIGMAFHLTQQQVAGDMARSFIVTGLACLLQVFFGHRLPLMEGQSGLWWGIILTMTTVSESTGLSLASVGGSLAVGMILGGIAVVLCGLMGLHRLLNRLFTPVVMAVLLLLLSAQLIDIFLRGMLGVVGGGAIHLGVAAISILVTLSVGALTLWGKGLTGNFSILIGIVGGWILFDVTQQPHVSVVVPSVQSMAAMFVWGRPQYNLGIVITGILAALLNTTNTMATLRAAEDVFERAVRDAQFRRSFSITGLFTMVAGVFSLVPYAPYTSSIGFLRTTRLYSRISFMVGASLFLIMGMVPALAGLLSTMPVSVGDAVLFIAYLQLFGSALGNLEGIHFTYKSIFRIAIPVLTGLALLAMPGSAFSSLPGVVKAIASNGMLVGILLAIILENTIRWQRFQL